MTKLNEASEYIVRHYNAIQGVKPGEEASLTAVITPYIPQLIEALIGCFSNRFSSQQVAEQMRNPSVFQIAAARRACRNKAREIVTRDENPDGTRITKKRRNKLRKEVAEDLFTSMMSSMESATEQQVVELVEEVRG